MTLVTYLQIACACWLGCIIHDGFTKLTDWIWDEFIDKKLDDFINKN